MVLHSPPPPPPPTLMRGRGTIPDEELIWSAERIHKIATETLLWCTNHYKRSHSSHVRVWYIMVGASVVTGFVAVGLAALPAKGRALLVNLVGFGLPAVATIRDGDKKSTDHPVKPGAFTGYWVRAERISNCCCKAPAEGGNMPFRPRVYREN